MELLLSNVWFALLVGFILGQLFEIVRWRLRNKPMTMQVPQITQQKKQQGRVVRKA